MSKEEDIYEEYNNVEKRKEREKGWLLSLNRRLEIIISDEEIQQYLDEQHYLWLRRKKSGLHNLQKRPVIHVRARNNSVKIEDVIELFNLFELYKTKKFEGGVPLPVNDERHNWENQLSTKLKSFGKKKVPSLRTIGILMPDGSIKPSDTYDKMKHTGITAEQRNENRELASKKLSEISQSHKQWNEIEAISISLFIKLIKENTTTEYTFSTIFDGLQADFMIRNNKWPPNQWVPIQIKSANIGFGKYTRYTIVNKYENIYCLCIGLLYYNENIEPKNCNDTTNTAKIFEILDMGKARSISTTPGLKSYEYINRLYVSHELIDKKYEKKEEIRIFIDNMLLNIEKFPRFTKEIIFFDIGFNELSKSKIIEMKGIETIYKILEKYGINIIAPKRQNETVDYIIEYNKKCICVSQKSSSITRKNFRSFSLGSAPNSHFVDIIIAICTINYDKISLIPSGCYNNKSLKSFNWCESSAEHKGVKEFNISTTKGEIDFVKALFPDYLKQVNRFENKT
jgi:hypothetical protein